LSNPENLLQPESEILRAGERDIPNECLGRLAAFESDQNRILNMMRFMLKASRINEELLKELDKGVNLQNIQMQNSQEAFYKFYQDTHSWAEFVNTTLEFNQSHFSEKFYPL